MARQSNVANVYGLITDTMIKTANFTLTAMMNGYWIRCQTGGGAITVTVPPGLQEGFTCVLYNEGANSTLIAFLSGVTLNSVGGLLTVADQFGEAGLFSYAPNVYKVTGNLS